MRFEFDNYNMIFDFEQNKCSIAGHAKEIDSLLLTSDIVSVEIKYVDGMLKWECTVFCERSCFKWIEFGLIVDKSPKVKEREERLFISCVPRDGFNLLFLCEDFTLPRGGGKKVLSVLSGACRETLRRWHDGLVYRVSGEHAREISSLGGEK